MQFKVFCRHEEFANRLSFYIFKIDPDGAQSICTSLDKMEYSRYEVGKKIDPTFSLTGYIINPFLKEIANTLKEIGIKAENEPVLENELSAVKYHLEDMRKLVFENKEHK
ncbi:MAG: hypothetical protein SVR08_11890 [Spirochaetota bacterium]|nr:hypothetical protein [Thermodesulfobacteriota bacterium]MDY6969336.1 hypothetical protein [Spirochaetota bacterium]